jgi:hypothetical protein
MIQIVLTILHAVLLVVSGFAIFACGVNHGRRAERRDIEEHRARISRRLNAIRWTEKRAVPTEEQLRYLGRK